jgi:hypothetical protein
VRRRRPRPKQRRVVLDAAFVETVRAVPPGVRPAMLGSLRGWRRRGERVFWVMDVVNGGWRQL